MSQYINKEYKGHIGVELEFLIVDENGKHVIIDKLLKNLEKEPLKGVFKPEAFTCAIEYNTPTCKNSQIAVEIIKKDMIVFHRILKEMKLKIKKGVYHEIPDGYENKETNVMCSRMWGNVFTSSLHIHIGLGDMNDGLKIYNCWVDNFDNFLTYYDEKYESKRLDKIVDINNQLTGRSKPHKVVKSYEVPFRLFGYEDNSKQQVYPYRYYYFLFSKHGTLENRVADCIGNFEKMYDYINYVYYLSKKNLS